ncbi:MAG: hypothetical protein H7841_18615, partial [Magnetospirillum sp. WYHS-4]
REGIARHGIRNGVLMTIAPTGTTAIYYGNVSSGLEPTFGWRYFRKVLRPDGSRKEFPVVDFGFAAWCRRHGLDPATAPTDGLPDHMVTALELSVEDHLRTQAVCQAHVDASISKTINCPPDMSWEAFQAVYRLAWELDQGGGPGLPAVEALPRHGRLVWAGDFLSPLEQVAERVAAFAREGLRGHLLQILDAAEETLPYTGRVLFEGPEGEGVLLAGRAEALREDYGDALARHRQGLAAIAAAWGWTFAVHRTDRAPETALLALHRVLSA